MKVNINSFYKELAKLASSEKGPGLLVDQPQYVITMPWLGNTSLLEPEFDGKAKNETVTNVKGSVKPQKLYTKQKTAFSVTEKGHKFDAEKYKLKARQSAERAEHLQENEALAAEGAPVKILNAIRFGYDSSRGRPDADARHYDYVAKKHREGKNAYNPWGGALTPSEYEEGGTSGILSVYGKSKVKKPSDK